MAVINTGDSAKKFIKPKYIVATMFTGSETDETAPLGDVYVLQDVIRDTTTLSPDENESTDIECETSDNPIMSAVTLGSYQFAAEVADTQGDLLKDLCGFEMSGSNTYYAPGAYSPKYAQMAIVMEDYNKPGELTAFVCAKVQLNSRMLLESMNSNPARIALAGTGQNITVTVNGNTIQTPFFVTEGYTLPTNTDTGA